MTVFKFLFVLALAVPLAVFMWNYINKLSDEFQKSVSRSRGSRRPEQPAGTERSPRPARSAGPGRSDRPARPAGAGRSDRLARTAGSGKSDRPARTAGAGKSDRPARSERPDTAEASAGKMQKPASKRKRCKARKKDRELRNRETRK